MESRTSPGKRGSVQPISEYPMGASRLFLALGYYVDTLNLPHLCHEIPHWTSKHLSGVSGGATRSLLFFHGFIE